MRWVHRAFYILFLATLLAGCGSPMAASVPLALAPVGGVSQPTYVLAPPNATATPTPFQPLEPTPSIQPTDIPLPTPLPTQTPTPTLAITLPAGGLPEEPELAKLPKQMNVLLLGSDKRPGPGGYRTDTIILVTINTELGQVNITSFPRDLYVTLPGWGMSRINTAWTYGGHDLMMATFKHNFGIQPDRFVLINFSSFKQIVDDFGGLTVNVTEPLSDYRAGYWVNIPAGEVQMDADMVLWYVRSRKTSNDIARNRRQQEVLQAIFEKLLSLNALRRAPEYYDLYRENVKTDITLVDVLTWLPMAAKIAETRNIKQYYITYKQVYDWITPEGAMVLVPNQGPLMQVIRKSQNLP